MSRSLNLLSNTAITTAGTVTGSAVAGLDDMSHLTFQSSLDWGSGGTAVKVYLQTTLDRGATWFDIACIAHGAADSVKALSVSGGASSSAPPTFTDGSLADDTVLDGFIGDQVRVKVVSTGTYAATTLDVDVVAKRGVSGSASAGGVSVTAPTSGASTNRSVTITTGGTAQQAAAALSTRKYLFIQNPSGSGGTLWFNTLATAVAASPSIELVAGASYENPAHFCPTGTVSVIHSVTNALITVREA